MVATLGKPVSRRARAVWALALALLWVIAVGPFSDVSAQTSMQKRRAIQANSPFNLQAGANTLLQANLVQCGLNNSGDVCTDVFDSPTGGGGFWPSGTTNQYIFNSGLQIAGVNSNAAGPWSNDTVGAFFFDARGTQKHGVNLTDVFNSLTPGDLDNWPEGAIVSDTSIFNAALIGSKAISDQDSYVEYWDGDPNRLASRTHPMGIKVQQRSLAFNAPAGAEHTLFFIYRFTNVTNDPAFQGPNEARFGIQLPDAGWTINNIYAAFAMDPDVTTHAGDNFSTAMLPLNMAIAYHATFLTDDFNFAARADLYAPPFFQGPGFVGVKYLRSPVNPATGQQVGLTMFSNTTNGPPFPDPVGVKQLFRYLKGDTQPAAGDPICTIPNSIEVRLCALVQSQADTRFFEASGPFSLRAGESAVIVVAYTHGPPVRVAGFTPGTEVRPGIPSRTPGVGSDTLRLVDRIAGLVSVTGATVTDEGGAVRVDETLLTAGTNFVQRSLVHNALIAQSIFNNKFLLPRPPETPPFSLVPGDNQVTVVWAPSATDVNCVEGFEGRGGDPFANIALDPSSPLFNPNYRRCDVEGYRIYRATGLSGGFELIATFDKIGTVITDVTCELDPEFVPEEGEECEPQQVALVGDVVQFREGGRVRNAVTGSVQLLQDAAVTITLEDTGVPFAFVDRGLRNGITYRYIVTAFDVNSLRSGAATLESPRQPQFVTPRKDPSNLVFASFESSVTTAAGQPLPTIAHPTVASATGIFSGPMPPTNGLSASFAPVVERLLPAFSLKATIDSIVPHTDWTHPSGACPKGSNPFTGSCWRTFMTFERDGTKSNSVADGFTPYFGHFGDPIRTVFPMGSGVVQPDPATAAQFGLPAAFPGFQANVVGTFPQAIMYSQIEGHSNRRSMSGFPIYPGFAFSNGRFVPAGSRWFTGTNETVADPGRLVRVGSIAGVDTIWAPIHHTPTVAGDASGEGTGQPATRYAGSTQMQCFSYLFSQVGRAADVRFTWGANGAVAATDVSHNTPVIFKPTAQASFGFLNTDANGNGVIDWGDFDHISNVGPAIAGFAGFCGHTDNPATRVSLENTAKLNPVSTSGSTKATAKTATGQGFGLYVNGERYIFQVSALPASGQAWTLRTYSGLLRCSSAAFTEDPGGCTYWANFAPDAIPEVRQPMVTGVAFNATSSAATGPVGDVDITQVHTVPDPYYVRSAFELGPSNKVLRFVNLPPQAIIRIYTLNGTLVRVLEHNDPLGGAETSWDLRNRNNQFVASGVYFYVVEAANGKKHTGKMTIVQFAR
ncbi:MAG: hypothetical protein ACT4O1_01830 [Gemmatimonadota bacterium]